MKAIVRDDYGSASVLRLEDIDRPLPEDDEVLVPLAETADAMRYLATGRPASKLVLTI